MREMKRNRHKGKGGGIVKSVLSFAMTLAMVSGTLPGTPFVMTARAESAASEKTITGLGTGTITNPDEPANDTDAWSGSYVYYGRYDGTNPTKYRVLDKASDKFGVTGGSLFLDCDSTLYYAKFDNDGSANEGASKPNEWAYSDVKAGLNGESFFTKTGNFTLAEKDAIAGSTVATHALVVGSEAGQVADWPKGAFVNYTPLTGEQIFLLDAEDASNIAYGYSTTDSEVGNRKKTGIESGWWLRSPNSENVSIAGFVCIGFVTGNSVNIRLGVSPAFNVNLSSVIFSSLIPSGIAAGSPGAEYKLTLKDGGLSIAAGAATKDADNKVSIPYTITDNSTCADPTQISVVVTDGTWTESGWSDGADLLQYEKLTVESFGTSGTGTFTLNSSIRGTWGTDYHVYILAEDVNGEKETDYASAPVEIKAITASATDYEGTYDGQAHGITVAVTDPTSGATVKYGESAENCTLEASPTIINVSDSPKTVYYEVTADGYLTAKGSAVVTINRAEPTVTPPTAKNLNYTGSAQALVTAGTATGGEMQYALGTATEATQPYTTTIPTATNAGTYYVWYKAIGDENHFDSTPDCVTVVIRDEISVTVTFKVVNGSWNDGTTADKPVTLSGYEGDTLKLATAQIPAVGSKASDGYKAGSWDVTPSASTGITADTTYTYTYAAKDSTGATVTFKVLNGAWNDGTTADKTVTLSGYEGDTLKL
ncbi:MAG: hypothetical protein J6N53_11025, partial [Lachnospiraceae bacterium]|nr:hypothetical protein [Lachnospiraceae bacterium]